MFAVIKTGGKQYKVAKNDILKVEKLGGEEGSIIVLDNVLAASDDKGNIDLNSKAKVAVEILEQKKDKKVLVFKKKRRHNYRRKKGHRQEVTVIKITDIGANVKAKKATAAKATTAPQKTDATTTKTAVDSKTTEKTDT